eukprot:7706187-Heterocapsa_arctica.AAC.1
MLQPAQTYDITGIGVGDRRKRLSRRCACPFVGVKAQHGEHDEGASNVLRADLHEATLSSDGDGSTFHGHDRRWSAPSAVVPGHQRSVKLHQVAGLEHHGLADLA